MDILIIDDDPFLPKLLGMQLRNLGLKERGFEQVLARDRGQDALLLLQGEHRVGLIFCDLQMPEMDGIEMVRHLVRIGYPGALVLISGEDEQVLRTAEKLARAHRLKVLGSLHKPMPPEQLQQVLDGVLEQFETGGSASQKRYAAEELRAGLARGELVNYYQPKVDIGSSKVVGVETLVRWRHPEDGLVLPEQFIGCAEQHGLIDELTNFVLNEALTRARTWRDAGLELTVAVNISVANLAALDFPDRVARAAARAGVPLHLLVLEVTESQLMQDPLAQFDILTRFRLKQVGLSIDDFGTGYSSLAQLRDLPFNEIKLDRGFVHGAWRDPALAAILQAHLGLARQLHLHSVAEGVEDAEDWAYLHDSGCDLAQGYYIAQPMPATQLSDWLRRWPLRAQSLPEAQT